MRRMHCRVSEKRGIGLLGSEESGTIMRTGKSGGEKREEKSAKPNGRKSATIKGDVHPIISGGEKRSTIKTEPSPKVRQIFRGGLWGNFSRKKVTTKTR